MSCDERTALLATGHQRGQRKEPHDIIVVAGKDPKDFEPLFTTADFSYGLTLEELLPFGLDPWWQKVRRLCFACLWLTFMLTLLASLCLAYYHDNVAACRTTEVLATTLSPPATLALATNGTLLLPSL
ncbi:uncharacterized protein [Drosophila virilis]|uniref:Solute carrier family 3 member 2 N-terminal domain-containing protein n=1 Tax=Drosophila virilis TaxID=7244 RepID=B4M639_DROVI|nr:uncharacterized protein LOC6632380 [Drosophila virilis]EDW59115.1 uncharacterized protein Dvir_GJ10699 [Drosophila virilis]